LPDFATSSRDLRHCADSAGEWLFEQALPVWLRHGVDRRLGGFHEALGCDGRPSDVDFKRLRVAARQVYVFVAGAEHGVAGAREAVDHGLEFILTTMRHPDGGFVSRCGRDGQITDTTRDLYDLAFVLFALAHGFRLTADAALRHEALALLRFIRAEMSHPGGGYHESVPPRLPRRQNPHMHLLEAALAGVEHIGDPAFAGFCDELADLYEQRLFDAETGTLGEYYADDWRPHCPDGRIVTEPGHHLEWAWLLAETQRLCGRRVHGADALAGFALRHGLDPASGFLRGEVFSNGDVANSSVRIWAHCEWLKAAVVLDSSSREAGDPVVAWRALSRFLGGRPRGLWFERWDHAAGGFTDDPAPASSLYHITSAIVALRRYAR
jgi:mannose-6-phosphate isomerase